MLREGVDFKVAAKALGAWQTESLSVQETAALAERRRRVKRLDRAVASFSEAERALRCD
jgi:hypothetical protein